MRSSPFALCDRQQDPPESGQHAEKVGCQGAVVQGLMWMPHEINGYGLFHMAQRLDLDYFRFCR